MSEEEKVGQLFGKLSVKELMQPNGLVTLPEGISLRDAISKLTDHKILSAPVQSSSFPSKYLGFVDLMDLLGYIMQVFLDSGLSWNPGSFDQWCQKEIHPEKLENRGNQLGGHSVRNCVDFSKKDPFSTVYVKAPASSLLYTFSNGLRRAAVTNGTGEVVGIVTQSDVVRFLGDHLEDIGQMKERSVESLGLIKRKFYQIPKNSKAISAFHILWAGRTQAAAVVDDAGKLVANLCLSDLKVLKNQSFGHLGLPIGEVLKNGIQGDEIPIWTEKSDASFENIVKRFVHHNVHRIWVVDNEFRPEGYISLSDVIRLISFKVLRKKNGYSEVVY